MHKVTTLSPFSLILGFLGYNLKMATFNKIFILVLISIVVSINILGTNGDGEPSVEIEDVWGTATIPAGKSGMGIFCPYCMRKKFTIDSMYSSF